MNAHFNDIPKHTLTTSISLLNRAKEKDGQAWVRLAELYTPLVYSWCRRSSLRPEDTQDVIQEVFKAVSKGLEIFQKDEPGQSFRNWLREITRCKIADHFRRVKKRAEVIGGTDHWQAIEAVPFDVKNEDLEASSGADQGILISTALKLIRTDFDEGTCRAFEMLVLEGRTVSDVAAILNKSEAAVRQANYRVRRRLRDEFDDFLA